MSRAGLAADRVARRMAFGIVAAVAALAIAAAPAVARRHHSDGRLFYVGAAKVDLTPTDLSGFYLGGYGIGPSHLATSVLRHIYFRTIAIRDRSGNQVVMGVIDSQGYSVAYQQGPYGFRDVENQIQSTLGIPADHIILQATHSHNGPDEIGVWGGVPDAYLQFVARSMESAITQAVTSEQAAHLRVGTADMTGFSGTFGSDTDSTHTGDSADYPMDQQLRVLQAVSAADNSSVIATLLNYSTHATVYGPRNQVSPDWPGAAATYLEGDELDMPAAAHYGYPGSTAIVTVGAMGHTWPAGIPASDTDPGVQPIQGETNLAPKDNGQNNIQADQYGNAVAQRAIDAVNGDSAFWVRDTGVDGTERMLRVANTNPVLLAAANEPANSTPLGGYKIDRSTTPPWGYGDAFVTPVTTLRVGDIPFFAVPGEPYPSIKFSLNRSVQAPVSFIFGLAQDQLGYAEEVSDYNGAFQCSATDEWFFTISPVFGSDVARISQANARALGLPVTGRGLGAYGPGNLPPATNCTEQQAQAPTGALPVG